MKIVTAEEMKRLDRRATSEFGLPSLLLMENAARGLVDEIERTIAPVDRKKITILAGRGNNGGDGLAAARHLRMRGASVTVYLLSPPDKVVGDAKISLDTWNRSGGDLRTIGASSFKWRLLTEDLSRSDLILDALLGTGLSQPVTGEYAKAIESINRSGRIVLSVDIPSGVSADTGDILGTAVKADYTFTMALPKRGHFMGEGLERRGKWRIVDIGFPPELIERANIAVNLLAFQDAAPLLPSRRRGDHKGTFGHLLVIAGSTGKRGAAEMASLAALRCGVGLVTIGLPQSLERTGLSLIEAMTLPLPETVEGTLSMAAEKVLLREIKGKSAIALGPGLSQNRETQAMVRALIENAPIPMVIDADGVNALAGDLSVLKRKKAEIILTPHPGEMGRLIGKKADIVQKERMEIASAFAEKWGVTVILKGAHTLIASPDRSIWVNNTGNPGMATAGTGDALTGMIAGWIAQGLGPKEAGMIGVFLHGLAGDLGAEEKGEVGLITSDLLGKIPSAIQKTLKVKTE